MIQGVVDIQTIYHSDFISTQSNKPRTVPKYDCVLNYSSDNEQIAVLMAYKNLIVLQ